MEVIDLFEELRSRGFSIGVDQYLSAHRLIARVAETTDGAPDPARLKTLLAPLVCRSPDEQARFYDLFDGWQRRAPPIASPSVDDAGKRARPLRQRIERAQRTGHVLRIAIVVTIAGAMFSVLGFESRVRRDPTGWTSRIKSTVHLLIAYVSQSSGPSIDAYDQPTVDRGARVPSAAPIVPPSSGRRWWWLLSPIFPALLLVGWRRFFQRGLGRAVTSEGSPLARIDLGRGLEGVVPVRTLRSAGRRLRERQFVAHDLLDPVATAEASARALGRLTARHRARFGQPEYLCLVDRRSEVDQLSDAILVAMRRMAMNTAVYTFDRDPRHCRSLRRLDVKRSLDTLARTHADHRLLVFSDGLGLTDRRHGHVADWVRPAFRTWQDRTLLTPVAEREWTRREDELADTGFRVMPGCSGGLIDLRVASGPSSRPHRRAPDEGSSQASGPLPPLLVEGETRWREAIPPSADELARLEAQLAEYLGPSGFQWLRACAVFPDLHLGLTLLLGACLLDSRGQSIGDARQLDRLLRLPWFRYGRLPDWLRRSLIAGLEGAHRRQVKQLICRWLVGDAAAAMGGTDTLVFARESVRDALVRAWASRHPNESPLRERLFYGFLTNDLFQRAAFAVPRRVRAVFEGIKQPALRRRYLPAWAVALMVMASALRPTLRPLIGFWGGNLDPADRLPGGLPSALLLVTGLPTAVAAVLTIVEWWWTALSRTPELIERPPGPPRALPWRSDRVRTWLLLSSTSLGAAWLLQGARAYYGSVFFSLYPLALLLMLVRWLSPGAGDRDAGAAPHSRLARP